MADFDMMIPPDSDEQDAGLSKKLEKLYYTCYVLLGGSSIEVDLEDDDYETAFEQALQMYRTVSTRSAYTTFGFMTLKPGQAVYVLNERVDTVEAVYRGRGSLFGSSAHQFDSWGAATAHMILRGGPGPMSGDIDLSSYDFMLQYLETLDILFANRIGFNYRNEIHTLQLYQTVNTEEVVGMKLSVLKSKNELLNDRFAYPFLQSYTLAQLRIVLGEKYSLFSTMPGAQGGTVMKGQQLLAQGREEAQKLIDDLYLNADSSTIAIPYIG